MTPISVSGKPLYLIVCSANGYIKESNGKKLTLIPNDENKDIMKKYEEIWIKIKDLIRSTNNNSDYI